MGTAFIMEDKYLMMIPKWSLQIEAFKYFTQIYSRVLFSSRPNQAQKNIWKVKVHACHTYDLEVNVLNDVIINCVPLF